MSTEQKEMNAKSLLAFIGKIDAEMQELQVRIALLEARIDDLKKKGKATPELLPMLEELEASKTKLEGMRKRRKELSLVAYNQGVIEFQEKQTEVKERLKADKPELEKLFKRVSEDFAAVLKKLDTYFNKLAGADLESYDDANSFPKVTLDLRSPEALFSSLASSYMHGIAEVRLTRHFQKELAAARALAKQCGKEIGVDYRPLIVVPNFSDDMHYPKPEAKE